MPVLVNVTVCGAVVLPVGSLPKERVPGTSWTTAPVPRPESVTVCGLPNSLSLIFSVPGRVPAVVGVKVTLMVQFAPTARVEGEIGQLFVWPKLVLAVMLVIESATFP